MRVLLIDVNYKYSSTGKIVHDLAHELIATGHQARVLFGRGELIDSEIALRVASVWEVYFHALMTRLTGLVGIFSYFATKRMIKAIIKFKPDVVHLHELHGYYVNYSEIVRLLKSSNIPVVWTFHCEFMYTGKCGHANSCEKWKIECHNCPQIKEYPASLGFDFTRLMFNQKKQLFEDFNRLKVVTPSYWLADRVRKSFLKTKSINVIHNGIDTEEVFFPKDATYVKEKYKLNKKKVILSVAPDIMGRSKGGQWILELSKLYSTDYVFVMIGVKDLSVSWPSNVIALSKTNNQNELADFYSAADLFLLTSEKETFSLVTAESLACGTPVVGFDSGAPTEVAPEGFGSFVPYGDIGKLSQLISGFFVGDLQLNDPVSCREFAVNNYSKSGMYKKHIGLYKESIKNSEL